MKVIGQLHGRVLILDDDVMVLNALKNLLEDRGLTVTKATGTRDFPELATPAPDLVIAELHLGTEDGLAVITSLRKLYPNTEVPADHDH